MPINVYTANRDDTWLFRATGNGPFNYTFPGVYMPPSKHMTGNYTNGAGPFTETRPGA